MCARSSNSGAGRAGDGWDFSRLKLISQHERGVALREQAVLMRAAQEVLPVVPASMNHFDSPTFVPPRGFRGPA